MSCSCCVGLVSTRNSFMTTIYGYVRGAYGMLSFTGNEMSDDITPAGFFGTSIMDIS